ncbi:thioredoxin [Bacillus pinisoli]|nr:thioredoxin [Bacillus pinisoli]
MLRNLAENEFETAVTHSELPVVLKFTADW